jgi:hypothetical protein
LATVDTVRQHLAGFEFRHCASAAKILRCFDNGGSAAHG